MRITTTKKPFANLDGANLLKLSVGSGHHFLA